MNADRTPCAREWTVLVVEDDPAFLAHLREIVVAHGSLRLAMVAATRAAGLRGLDLRPDLVLVDVGLPDGSGLDIVAEARRRYGVACRVMIVSVFGDAVTVVGAVEAGADGYLLKGADGATIAEAIDTLIRGGSPISPAIAGHILARLRAMASAEKPAGASLAALTPREVELPSDLSKGFSYKEIANLHRISYHTVADHVKSIYRKMAVNSRGEAVYEAMQTGLLPTRS